ncbi:MAG: TIGR02147 family protein [Fibrobacter sp.]|nr:TIGR02147 family protein [Fibrobacter sp.]
MSKKKKNKESLPEPDVLHYTNYRVYLKDFYNWRKKTSSVFSLRYFAEKAGLSSHAHLKLAMDGTRNVTKSTVTKIIVGLGLTGKKAEYFENLVFFNQAKDSVEKQIYYENLVKCTPRSRFRKLEDTQFRIFREWHHILIREMIALEGFSAAPEWFMRRMRTKLSRADIQDSLKLLQELGLITRTPNGYKQNDTNITTDDEVQYDLVRDFHEQMLKQASLAMGEVSAEERDISSLIFPIKAKEFPNLKKHLQLMRKEILDFSADEGEGDDIVQVNIQLFPLTRN